MLSDFLDREYVVAQTRAQRDWLVDLQKKARAKDAAALAAMKRYGVSLRQIQRGIAALDDALARAGDLEKHSAAEAFIPPDPVICGFQAGATEMAERRANTVIAEKKTPARRSVVKVRRVIDTVSIFRRTRRPVAARRRISRGGSLLPCA